MDNKFVFLLISITSIILVANIEQKSYGLTYLPVLTVDAETLDFEGGKKVIVSGKISTEIRKDGVPILIEVFSPSGELYNQFEQSKIRPNGDYGYTFEINGTSIPGDYQILISYNGLQVEKIVRYLENYVDEESYQTYVVKVDDQTYPIRCKIQGTINSILADQSYPKLYISYTTRINNGKLTIELPRHFIDAKQEGDLDKNFFIGTGAGGFDYKDFRELESFDELRTLEINLRMGSDNIIIMGTHMVPEFHFAFLVLAVSIIGLIFFAQIGSKIKS